MCIYVVITLHIIMFRICIVHFTFEYDQISITLKTTIIHHEVWFLAFKHSLLPHIWLNAVHNTINISEIFLGVHGFPSFSYKNVKASMI